MSDEPSRKVQILFGYDDPDEAPVLEVFDGEKVPKSETLRAVYGKGPALYETIVTNGEGTLGTLIEIL